MRRVPSSARSLRVRLAPATSIVASLLILTACGSEPSSPSSPSPPASSTPTVSALRIDGADAVRTGLSSDYTATVTLSNGTTQTVTPTWSISNASVASVDGNGRVTGQAHGQATLTATHQGATASKPLSVIANFAGQWSGRYVMRACDQSGVFLVIGYCQSFGGVGAAGPITLGLTQSGTDQSQLSGAVAFGSLAGNVTGNVTPDGRMVIGGNFNIVSSGVTFTFRVGGWESRLSGPSNMTGKWADNLAAVGVSGNVYTENELVTMTRIAAGSAMPPAVPVIRLDWQELFASLRGHR